MNTETNRLWNECYRCIRRIYTDIEIVIVDDGSCSDYVQPEQDLVGVRVIDSEFPGGGEVLPLYQFWKQGWWDRAVFIHDSVFVNKYVNWDEYEEPFYKLWYFNSNGYDNKITEMRILQQNGLSEELIQFYIDHNNWCGCFGGMFMADIGWVRRFCEICDLEKVFEVVRDREMRMSWERVFGVYSEVLYGGYGGGNHNANIFGDIHDYIQWGTSFDEYLQMKERGELEEYPVVKTWVGR